MLKIDQYIEFERKYVKIDFSRKLNKKNMRIVDTQIIILVKNQQKIESL